MPSDRTYFERKKNGACVRCGMPAYNKPSGEPATMCATHLRMQQEYERVYRNPDDGLTAVAGVPDERRLKWEPKTDHLPPLPKVCPRCGSMLVRATVELYLEYTEAVRCPCCGFLTDRQMLQNKLDAETKGDDDERAA